MKNIPKYTKFGIFPDKNGLLVYLTKEELKKEAKRLKTGWIIKIDLKKSPEFVSINQALLFEKIANKDIEVVGFIEPRKGSIRLKAE